MQLLLSQLPHGGSVADLLLGAGCSPVLRCLHNFHSCTVLSNILSLLRISWSSVRHFTDLSWIVEDLPCFYEVRSFTADMLSCSCFLFRQVSISSLWAATQSSFAFFSSFWILLFASLYSFCFIPLLLQISSLVTELKNIFGDPWLFPATYLPKYLTGTVYNAEILKKNLAPRL